MKPVFPSALNGARFLLRAGMVLLLLWSAPTLLAAEASADSTTGIRLVGLTAATLGLVLWFALVWWARRAVLGWLEAYAERQVETIAAARLRQISLRRFSQLARAGARLVSVALLLAGAFVWATAGLEFLPGTQSLADRVEHVVWLELEKLLLASLRSVPDLLVVAVIFFVARLLHEALNHYFRSIVSGELKSTVFDPVTAETTRRLADLGVWIAAVIIAFPYIPGSDSAAFRGVSVLAGLMLSLGSANLVAQFASGLSLIYGRAIRPGEYIQTGQAEGTVERVGLFACSLRTPRDELVVVPHTVVAGGLRNFSRGTSGVRLTTEVTLGYDTPWRQVRELLLAAAQRTPGIRAEPAPAVRQAALEDFYVRYELQFTPTDPRDRSALLGHLHAEIQDRFQAAGVQIMSPHYRGDPAAPKIPPGSPA